MRRGNWFSGFAALRSLIWAAMAALVCMIASFAVSNVRLTLAPDSGGISTPVLVAPAAMAGQERATDGVVYELDGAYYQIDPTLGAQAPLTEPKSAPSSPAPTDPGKTSSAISKEGNSIYVAEDSIGFLAVVVSEAGRVQVYRQADESFVSE